MAGEDADELLPRETVAKRRKSQRTEKKLDFATTSNSTSSDININNNSCSASDLTPLAACSSARSSTTETNSLLNSRSRLGSSSFTSFSNESIGAQQRHFSGLPAYIVDIPPIPSLHGLGSSDEDKDNHHRAAAGSKSLSSRSRSGSTSMSTSTPEAIRSFKAIRRSSSVDLSNL